ncbi:CCR4-Not complex component, Not1-domain-containing protein [Jimgerdemannia flammicorona]|uniref:General negative regulator of transcription subunit 1 n=1 Tax=Jimgerdemannia flammicorona TaxID=994334 RepID=A0A433R0B2_9FUNG|nr:CCR4-Not complex component, Not1-domain-containing protein [Jimgerdemannia flammicorona]
MIGCADIIFTYFQPIRNILHQEFITRLLTIFLNGHSGSSLVFTRLWQLNPNLLVSGFLDLYNKDATSLSRILDVAQDLKILTAILQVKPFPFAIDLAALASRREYLNLEKWLQDNIAEHKDVFIRSCLDFLSQKIASDVTRQDTNAIPQSVPLSVEVMAIFLRVLLESSMSPENAELLKEVHSTCLQSYPKLMNVRSGGDSNSTGGEVSFSEDVEEEANSYYEQIYRGDMSIEHMIDLLQRFKNSNVPREQDVFACMIHNLFDEYRFFPKYPEKELAITGVLFGSLIQYQLVSYIPLGIALRYVLDALRQPAGSKMFGFGVQALLQFQSRLPEWPQYCSHLLQIPQLQQAHPEIVRYIQSTLQGNGGQSPDPSAPPVADSLSPKVEVPEEAPVKETKPVFTALNVDTLLANADQVNFEIPNESVQDKILFIINNVAQANLEAKTAELRDILGETAYQWFSHYLVVKRASIEPNYHQLYLLLLEALESQQLYRHVLHETYTNIKILLNGEKTVQSSSERALLKNLGSWLGGMTVARNKPIKHKNIAFKELLIEGYDNNRLIVVIPFVCKVLEQCSKSKVFKPPNPWLMAILRLLVELYLYADLKLNLKFEIEVLCKSLSLELNEIEPTTILKNRPPKELVAETSALIPDTIPRVGEGGYAPSARAAAGSAFLQGPQENHFATSPSLPEETMTINLPNLAAYLIFNPNLTLFATQPALRRLVSIAVDKAIREIIGPVVERSVTIAGLSTRDMIIKDFAMEPDENKMRKAAHLMVQNLAGSLAMVTCKEPLRLSMVTHMRNLFLQNGFTEQTLPEQAIMIVVNENSELACSIIEKAAMEKALPEIDEALASGFNNRKKHRERTNQPFYDMSVFSASRYPSSLPEPLRLKPNGLQMQQLRVYEDFARSRMQNQLTTYGAEPDRVPRATRPEVYHPSYGYAADVSYEGGAQAQAGAHQILEKFAQFIAELDKQISQTSAGSFNVLPQNHDIRLLVRQIPVLASQSFNRVETAMTLAQKVVQLLYKSESNLARETYVALLERLCETSNNVAKEVTTWLVYADDERKYNVPVTVALIRSGLISLVDQDMQLAKLIENGRPTVIDFTTKLVRTCVLEEPSCATRQEFINSLEALNRLAQRAKAPESVLMLLDDIRRGAQKSARDATRDDENAGLREQLQYLFTEWVRLYQYPSSNEKAYLSFLNQLAQQGVFKGDDISSMFFRICTETCVDHFLKNKPSPGTAPTASYQPIDAFSKLVVLLVKIQTDPTNTNNNAAKINQLSKILSIIVLVLAQQHEQRRHQFNQKPFLRLFSSLLNDFNSYEHHFQSIYFQILSALGHTFHTLQPLYFPGFTFAWLQLISHRLFMPKLLLADHQKGWPVFQRLLICLFTFLVPFLRNVELRETTRMLYRGTLRVLLVLLHDFPEFLCDYHFSFCDVIPASCIQLRNLILSAFPRNMRLPDPFTPNLKVDLLPEINQSPRVLSDYSGVLLTNNFKQDVDVYLKTRAPVPFLLDLRSKLLLDPNSAEAYNTGSKYNVPVINGLVLYVGIQAIAQSAPITHSAPMDIYQQLLLDLDSEGRYLFLSAIANQLRYPNSHTHYFSCVLLYLFAEGNQEIIKEQVTRVLLERLIVNRPHPWGLLITFIELIKNPRYNFWNHSFTRCATDIERLFESVSRSINQT